MHWEFCLCVALQTSEANESGCVHVLDCLGSGLSQKDLEPRSNKSQVCSFNISKRTFGPTYGERNSVKPPSENLRSF